MMDNETESKKGRETGLEQTNYLLMSSIKLCDKYYTQIEKKLRSFAESQPSPLPENANELKELEQQFWSDLKSAKESNEGIVIAYIVGVYLKLQQLALLHLNTSRKNDVYFIHGIELRTGEGENEFLYNLYIHLGDLSRYQKNGKTAKQFYLKARWLNPNNGQSYNQLALIHSQDPIKSIYYYARAYLAVEPSKIALNNLKLSVKHFLGSSPLVKLLFDRTPSAGRPDKIKIDNWLYLTVIAIFAENVAAMAQYLFDELNYWFKFKSITINSSVIRDEKDEIDQHCLFASFDLFLDYCSVNAANGTSPTTAADNTASSGSSAAASPNLFSTKLSQFNPADYERQLRDFKRIIDDYSTKIGLTCTAPDPVAFRHDFMLQGLSLLTDLHAGLTFTRQDNQGAYSLNRLIARIGFKLGQLLEQIDRRSKSTRPKKMRNVALQSILNAGN